MEEYRAALAELSKLRREFPLISNGIDACARGQGTKDEKMNCIAAICIAQAIFRTEGTEGCMTYGAAMDNAEKQKKEAAEALKDCN